MCPAELILDYSHIRSDGRTGFRSEEDSLFVDVKGHFSEFIRPVDYPSLHRISVSRTTVSLGCYYGLSRSRLEKNGKRLVIPLGADSDRLYSFRQIVPFGPNTEESYVMPTLGNDFTKVIVSFPEGEWDTSLDDYILKAIGNTCGIDLRTGTPLSGPFSCELRPYDSHSYCFNMPRQEGRDIRVSVLSRKSGEELFVIDLASELEKEGYGWTAQNLAPLVVINIDMASLALDVNVMDWDEVIYFNYEI